MNSSDDKVIPSPIRRLFEPAESQEAEPQDDYPDGVIVRALTDLHFADEGLSDWIVCPLKSPGKYVPSGGDLIKAFEAERTILSRVLSQLAVLDVAEEPSVASLSRAFRTSPDESGERIELGTILALLRIALGWSVDDLARASRLRSKTISGFEEGRMIPGLNSVAMVMEAMACPFSALDVARTCIGLLRSTRKRSLWTQRDHSAGREEGPA